MIDLTAFICDEAREQINAIKRRFRQIVESSQLDIAEKQRSIARIEKICDAIESVLTDVIEGLGTSADGIYEEIEIVRESVDLHLAENPIEGYAALFAAQSWVSLLKAEGKRLTMITGAQQQHAQINDLQHDIELISQYLWGLVSSRQSVKWWELSGSQTGATVLGLNPFELKLHFEK